LQPLHKTCADAILTLPHTCPGGAETRAAALAPRAEDALRGAVFRGAARAPGAPSPAEALLAALRQPDAELRVAAYRCELGKALAASALA